MNITEFLEARIAEDEKWAQQEDTDYADTTLLPTYDSENQANWSTPRVLAECAAKRAIIAEHGRDDHSTADYCETCAEWWKSEVGEGPPGVAWPCPSLRAIAAVYADHPNYDPEWAL